MTAQTAAVPGAPEPVPLDREILAWHGYLLQRAQAEPGPAAQAVAAVLEEHRVIRLVRYDVPVCRACWYTAERAFPTAHPCRTVAAISRAFGVPVPRAGQEG